MVRDLFCTTVGGGVTSFFHAFGNDKNTMKDAHGFARILTLAGALPFIGLSASLWLAPTEYHAKITTALITYAAIILSFLGGIQWGGAVALAETAPKSARTMWLLSIVPSLLAWLMLFVSGAGTQLLIAITLFTFVWIIDALLHVQKLIPLWFFRFRTLITAIVLGSILAALPKV
jgi:hypothetical protein